MPTESLSRNRLFLSLTALLFLSLFITYFPLLKTDPILKRDDVQLITPLKTLTGFGDYVSKVSDNTILDLQPLRDLTYILDIQFYKLTGVSVFHLSNFIYFVLTCFILVQVLQRIRLPQVFVIFILLLFMSHPLLVSYLGWISSRKHALGLLFILFAIKDVLKSEKVTLKSSVFYLLAILSHQIFILFPLWCLIYERSSFKRIDWRNLTIMAMFACLVFGLATYKALYLEMGNVSYKTYSLLENFSRFILLLGRSTSLIIFPKVIAGAYSQGSIWNLVGLPVLILMLYFLYKGKNSKTYLVWMLLAFLTLVPCYITNFLYDPYLYLPLICVLISLGLYFKDQNLSINRRAGVTIAGLMVVLFFGKSFVSSRMWMSDKNLWQYSYEQEESPFSAILLGAQLKNQDPELAFQFIVEGGKHFDLASHYPILKFFVTEVYTANIPIQEKIKIFEECYTDIDLYKAFYASALLEGDNDQMQKGISILKPFLKEESQYTEGSEGRTIIRAIRYLCLNIPNKNQVCDELKIKY